ncbi:MAG: NAD(P)-binding domain-containing protein [Muribaculaceae bacterium]|nr:NAD(P)-binding domain-containing protein [Muribaculaceae bacterium]
MYSLDNILIIGAGAMGSAIARGLAKAGIRTSIYNRSEDRLEKLREVSDLRTYTVLTQALYSEQPSLVIVALPAEASLEMFAKLNGHIPDRCAVATLSPMISIGEMKNALPAYSVARIMPNIGITHGQSMTFVCADSDIIGNEIRNLFKSMGDAVCIAEEKFPAVTALASCGTAYALRYIRACMQAGVQMGLEASDACRYTVQTLLGACSLLEDDDKHPESEIDKVCTPGGLTIQGLNALDRGGFSAAVIDAILTSYKK